MILKKKIYPILLLVLIFYYIYPTALPLFGYSFIFTGAVIGLTMYVYHQYPYSEVINFLLLFGAMALWSVFCTFIGGINDTYIVEYSKSQLGWLFSAYFVIYFFYKIHPKGGVNILIYYIIGAIFLQCVISVAMYADPEINKFFNSIQNPGHMGDFKRMQTEGKRLLGYGSAFFGAGITCGLGLILLIYIVMSTKLNFFKSILVAFVYISILCVGLLSARTTLVGAVASIILLIILLFLGGSKHKTQGYMHLFYSIILLSVGLTVMSLFMPETVVEWALEPFRSYEKSGNFSTVSSNGLYVMFMLPEDLFVWIFGTGKGTYWGSDVGFTRLLFWFGVPGTLLFFLYQYKLIKQSFTNNKVLNITLLITFGYNIALNVKGLSDLNLYWLLFAFYFLYYKYYIYTPYLYRLGKVRETSLRNAVQVTPSGRRI